jgi:hypothetical protein
LKLSNYAAAERQSSEEAVLDQGGYRFGTDINEVVELQLFTSL